MTIQFEKLREQINGFINKAILDYNQDPNPECAFVYYVPSVTYQILSLDGLLIEVVCPKCNGSGSWYQADIEPYNPCDRCEEKGYIIIPTKELLKDMR